MVMKKEVEKAVAEIRSFYSQLTVEVLESTCGGAYVLIHDLPLGAPYTQSATWIAFFITNACPYADTYPFYVRADLSRIDGVALKAPIHVNNNWAPGLPDFAARPAVMVSRRQNHQHCIGKETPLLKLQTVVKWMLQQ
jgi:hypothetical protein